MILIVELGDRQAFLFVCCWSILSIERRIVEHMAVTDMLYLLLSWLRQLTDELFCPGDDTDSVQLAVHALSVPVDTSDWWTHGHDRHGLFVVVVSKVTDRRAVLSRRRHRRCTTGSSYTLCPCGHEWLVNLIMMSQYSHWSTRSHRRLLEPSSQWPLISAQVINVITVNIVLLADHTAVK